MPSELEELLIANVDLLERLVRSTCRRCNMNPADVEDFGSWVKVHLIENDYGVLRKFEGRCSLATYLAVVIQRLLNDYRIHHWGKWHTSAEAKRLGPTAIMIERLLYRDRKAPDEAFQILSQSGETIPRAEFDAIAARLPERRPRARLVDVDDVSGELSMPPDQIELDAAAGDRSRAAGAVSDILRVALEKLPEEDRTILRLHFFGGMTVAEVARALQVEQKPLYRRIAAICKGLREALVAAGIDAAQAADIIGRPEIALDFGLQAMGNSYGRPSSPMGRGTEGERVSP